MSRKEVPRAGLLKAALAGRITNLQGATALGLTPRQFQRLKVRFRTEGAHGLIHRGRGQASPRRLPPGVHGVGLPLSVYGDRINILVRNDRHWSLEEELHGAQDPAHLGRVLRDLSIGYIAAQSTQAKGRVERLWQTLQDRLVSELRLHAIATVEHQVNVWLLGFRAVDSSDPLTPLRFGDRSERRKRQKLLIRTDHFSFTLGAAIPPAKWTLVSCPGPPGASELTPARAPCRRGR